MGAADRKYQEQGGRRLNTPRLPPVTKWLLIINILVFLTDILSGQYLTYYGAFAIRTAIQGGYVWEFITFQFLHGSVGHIMFNLLTLYFAGPFMERWWGAGKFLAFYLLSGIGGALLYSLLGALGWISLGGGIVGASAGIFGILVGLAIIAPDARVALLFPPVELSMRRLALIMLGLAVVFIVFPLTGNAGGEAGHLGGAIVGALLVKFPQLLSWVGSGGGNRKVIHRTDFQNPREAKIRPRSQVNLRGDSEIDRILDKVSKDGFANLTDEERQALHREHERLQKERKN